MLKIDIINDAYSMGLQSGVTANPSPNEVQLALNRLEGMAGEWFQRGIAVNYNFEAAPDVQSEAGIAPWMMFAFSSNLMMRLSADFGVEPSASLSMQAVQSFSTLSSAAFNVQETFYSARMPIGSGNRPFNRYYRHYGEPNNAPLTPFTYNLAEGDAKYITLDFSGDMRPNEAISAYEITGDSNFSITDKSQAGYEVSALYVFPKGGAYQAKIKITGQFGTVINRVVLFNVLKDLQNAND